MQKLQPWDMNYKSFDRKIISIIYHIVNFHWKVEKVLVDRLSLYGRLGNYFKTVNEHFWAPTMNKKPKSRDLVIYLQYVYQQSYVVLAC